MTIETLLAIETSTNFCSVALLQVSFKLFNIYDTYLKFYKELGKNSDIQKIKKNGVTKLIKIYNKRIFIRHKNTNLNSSQYILPLVQEVLLNAKLQLNNCIAIAYGSGPGSFTGLRTAAGIVQGLAFGVQLPVIGISSLLACAERARLKQNGIDMLHSPQIININYLNKNNKLISRNKSIFSLVILDAKMNEIYWAIYIFQFSEWHCFLTPCVSSFEEMMNFFLNTINNLPLDKIYTINTISNFITNFDLQSKLEEIFKKYFNDLKNSKHIDIFSKKNIIIDTNSMPHAGPISLLAYQNYLMNNIQHTKLAIPEYVRNKVTYHNNKSCN